MAKEPSSQGVPRETPERNCFSSLKAAIAPVLGSSKAEALIEEIKRGGYFQSALIAQTNLIVEKLAVLGQPKGISKALFESDSDKIRSISVRVHFEHFKTDLEPELTSLKYSGALPGTWTQETSQSTLKEMIHIYGVRRILPLVRDWVTEKDPAVRRLVIEAFRPRGVWCKHIGELKRDPAPLKTLFKPVLDDKSDYVRKAVANSLNDISKDNPDVLCEWIAEWSKGKMGKERKWIIERSLRSLIKSHYPKAMKILGLDSGNSLEIVWKKGTPSEVIINHPIPFEFAVASKSGKPLKARLQLELIGPSKNSKSRTAKYLLGNLELDPRAKIRVKKDIKFAHKNFVPKLPGRYRLVVNCNGKLVGERSILYRGLDLNQ